MTTIGGFVVDGWGPVADAFIANFDDRGELGAACAVYHEGRPVVDLWGGIADARTGQPWREETVAVVFSATKGVTAILAHMLVQRRLLDLDAPVVEYWPAFGEAGKEHIPVRFLLAHQAGLPSLDRPITLAGMSAWEPVVRALASQTPRWRPGTHHADHVLTFGWLVGEVIRRISGETPGRLFAAEVADRLGVRTWIGPPTDRCLDVAHVEAAPRLIRKMGAPLAALWSAELPSMNLVTDAYSLARTYAAALSDVDGVRLLRADTVAAATVVQTTSSASVGCARCAPPKSLGFDVPTTVPMLGPSSFGHRGEGGSMAYADPEHGIAFAYVTNNLRTEAHGESRHARLTAAVRRCLTAR